ncbi:ParB N-terminal domain-containing protein [Luteitalea sp.]|uniref:ParB/RepB/Spo0J family partition protein n=1 Tax=Luteitalea sp. TaxID=2004800 RepID=UPI0025C531CE|nr:ParB N-terminal domain-containing protein [Luteitalea sp.]
MSSQGSAGPAESLLTHRELVRLPVADLLPNAYNPNQMTEAEFSELVAEVEHLGRCPKPIVVRREGAQWLIVDGEHGWRAAKAIGLPEVACEVVDVDKFEAMRQTYKRNQHGRHDPVRLGKMFRLMLAERACSQRGLATAMGVSDATVRNAMLYADAADLRDGYAVAPPADKVDVSSLTVRQVRAYVGLPPPVRDAWLDSGADLRALDRAVIVKHEGATQGDTSETDFGQDETGRSGWALLIDAGLAERVQASSFVESAHEAFRLLLFRQEFHAAVEDLDLYLRPIVELCLPASLVNRLPATPAEAGVRVVVTPMTWSSILRECAGRSRVPAEIDDLVRASVNIAVRQAGGTPAETTDPRTLDALAAIDQAPPFVRQMGLALNDQRELAQLVSAWTGPQEELPQIAERACRVLAGMRRLAAIQGAGAVRRQRERAEPATPVGAFTYAIGMVREERRRDEHRRALEQQNDLAEAVANYVAGLSTFGGPVAGVAMSDALRGRLMHVPLPELQLLGGLLLGVNDAELVWRKSLIDGRPGSDPQQNDQPREA